MSNLLDDDIEEVGAALSTPVKVDSKPDISRLKSVFNRDGMFTPVVGDKIILEVNAGGKWMHTREHRIVSIDPDTGNMWLYNDELGQNGGANYKTLDRYGFDMRLAPGRGVPLGVKRRGRPKRAEDLTPDAPPKVEGEKKRRGRPKKVQT